MSTTPPAQFFVSYSHLDRAWREQLFDGPISTPLGDCPLWTDACIQPGDDWRAVIEQQLAQCSVAVLLVSPHFLQSAFISGTEFPRFLARAEAHQVRIVWIPIAVTPQMLGERHPLASVQGILSFDDALPARPDDLPGMWAQLLDRKLGRDARTHADCREGRGQGSGS